MEDPQFPGNGLLEDFSTEENKKRQRRSTSKSGAINKKAAVSEEVDDDEDYGDDDSDDDPSWANDAKKQENEEEDDDDEEEEDEYEGTNKRKRGVKGFVNRKPGYPTPIIQRPNTTPLMQRSTPLSSSFDQSYSNILNRTPGSYGTSPSQFSSSNAQRPQLSPVQIQQLLEQNPMLKQALVHKLMAAQQNGTPVNPAVLAVLNSSSSSSASNVLSSNPSLLSQANTLNSSLLSSASSNSSQTTTITPPPPSLTVPALSSLRSNPSTSSPLPTQSSGNTISGLSTSGLSAASIFSTPSQGSSLSSGNNPSSLGNLGMSSPLSHQNNTPKTTSSSPSLLGAPSMGMSGLSSLGNPSSSLGMSVNSTSNSGNTTSTFAPYKFPTMTQPPQNTLPSLQSPSTSQSNYPNLLGPQQPKPTQQVTTQIQLSPQQVQQLQLMKMLNPNLNINEYVRMMYTNPQALPSIPQGYQISGISPGYSSQVRMSPASSQIDLATQLNQMQRSPQESPKTVKPAEIFGGSSPMTLGSPMHTYNTMNMSQMGSMSSQQYKPTPIRPAYPPMTASPNYTNLNAFAQNLKAPTPQMWPGNAMRIPPPGTQLVKPGSVDPKLEMEAETDPRRRVLLTLVKQCEAYSNQIKEILRQWHEKSLKNKAENESNPFRLPVENENPSTNPEDKESDLELIRQPENLKYELRPYQLVGLNWLYLLFSQKINGILADEMGLGKTIQTIGLFSLLKQRSEVKKPHLIIVPATALENWVREFTQCSPSVVVHMYHGSTKEREALRKLLVPKEDGQCNFDVIITTYNLSINKVDRAKFFKKFEFSYIVLDEAHSIKNVNSVRYQNLLKLAFRAEYRLMLTGTPLQNNVNELWALLNFLMPNIFGVAKDMKGISWPEEEGKDYADEVARIKKIISPFILRRLKSEVLGKLPPKKETIVWCQLTSYQKELYEKTFQYSKTNYYAIRKDPEEEEKKEVKTETKVEEPVKEKVEEEKPKEEIPEKVAEPEKGKETSEEKGKEETDKEKAEDEKDPEVKEKEDSLHHILMQLRKAANNTLLFRYYYDDARIYEIQDTLKKEEEEKKQQEREKLEQQQNEKLAAEQALMNAQVPPPPEQIKPEPMEIKSEIPIETQSMEIQIPPLQTPQDEIMQPVTPKVEEPKVINPNVTPVPGPLPMIGPEDVCGICLLEGNLLCCDGPCGRAFHLQCVGLQDEPTEEKWFCTDCVYFPKQEKPAIETPHRESMLKVMKEMEKLEDKNGRKRALLFLHLPSQELIPDYYKIIKTPISFNHIKQKYYENPEQFYSDIKLLFNNARTYNRSGSQVYRDAVALEKIALVEIAKEFKDLVKLEEADKKAATATPKRPPSTSRRNSSASGNVAYASPDDESEASEDEAIPTSRRSRNSRAKRQRAAAEELDDYLEFEEDYEVPKKRSRSSRSESSRSRGRSSVSEPKIPEPLPPRRKRKLPEPFLSCQEVLEDLMDQEDAAPFAAPIDPVALGIPDYHDIVKKPMDLGTIWNKLNGSEYPNPDQFVDDVRLVFDNCLLYNEPNSEIGVSAQMLWTYFKRQCRKHSIKVPEAKAQLEHKQTKTNNLASLADELKLKSDIEIHLFCKNYECLKSKFCLNDDQILTSSGKLLELRRILSDLFAKSHRVLIFSQFTMVLNILEEFLTVLGYKYLRMDGSTPVLDRQMLIDEYNTNREEIFVFLLSTRAAGLGINLTSADVCIFHDIDWNPEMDRQAEARVHRIGQMKEVEIIKILARESVDEYILKLADMKRHRNDLVMGEGKQEGAYSELDKLSIGKVLASIFEQQTETLK